jgi:hypothetical protein
VLRTCAEGASPVEKGAGECDEAQRVTASGSRSQSSLTGLRLRKRASGFSYREMERCLLRRMPNLRLKGSPESLTWRPGLVLRGLKGLPVIF